MKHLRKFNNETEYNEFLEKEYVEPHVIEDDTYIYKIELVVV